MSVLGRARLDAQRYHGGRQDGVAHSHDRCVMAYALAGVNKAIADVRMAAEANGHGWITRTDAWHRLIDSAALAGLEEKLR